MRDDKKWSRMELDGVGLRTYHVVGEDAPLAVEVPQTHDALVHELDTLTPETNSH